MPESTHEDVTDQPQQGIEVVGLEPVDSARELPLDADISTDQEPFAGQSSARESDAGSDEEASGSAYIEAADDSNHIQDSSPAKRPASPLPSSPQKRQALQTISPQNSPLKSPRLTMSPGKQLSSPQKALVSPQKSLASPRKSLEPAKSRLVIERLVLINFKSYAGKQVVGPFHPSFSAVVGPNGSGKSNVIDSLLFVFGFRASKMRQSKLSELIHNSENFRDLPFCQVDVHFRQAVDKVDANGREYSEYVPGSDLVVSRKAFRNNSSDYYINGRRSKFTEVRSLLYDQGIDLDHKRFLILQGEVESIAQMKPKADDNSDDGLLEYLEDIIGTSSYKEPINEGTKKIDELNDVCVEKERRFEFVEKSKDELEEPKQKALEYLAREKEFLIQRSTFLQYSLRDDQAHLEDRLAELEQLQAKMDEAKKESSQEKAKSKELHSERDKLTKDLDATNDEITESKKSFKKIEREKVSMEEKIKHMENSKKKAEKSLEAHKFSIGSAETTLTTSEQNLAEYTKEEEQLKVQLQTEKDELEKIKLELSDKTKQLSQQVDKLQQELQPWKDQIDKNQGELDIKNSELEMLKKQLQGVEGQQNKLQEALTEKKDLIDAGKKQISTLHQEKKHVSSQIKLGEGEVNDARKKLHVMETQLASARQKAEDAKSRVRSTESRNRMLNALTHLRDSGRLEGFHGRLGDLGIIPDRYDVAVSTGGGSLEDMVVDTVECAQQCIAYIRKNGLGFGKFIVLNKLRKFNMSRIQTPENVPRLFDLIEPLEPKFAPAFYSSMYDTLVTPDLKTANRVAFGKRRWRVVTEDGKLVDSSGTMSGGGSAVYRGAMKLKSKNKSTGQQISPQELNKLVNDAQQKEAAFDRAQSAYREMEQALGEFRDRLPQIDNEESKLNIEIEGLQEEIASIEKQLKQLSKDSNENEKKYKKEIADVTKTLATLERKKVQLKQDSQGLEQQIAVLQQQIMDAGGVRLKVQKSKVDSVLQKLEILEEKSSSDSMAISKAKTQIKRLEKQVADCEKQIEKADKSIEEIRAKFETRMQEFDETEQKLRDLTSKKDDLVDSVEGLATKLEEVDAKVNSLRQEEITMMAELEKCQILVNKYQKQVDNVTASAGSFQFRDLSDSIDWMDEEERAKYIQNEESLPKLEAEDLANIDGEGLKAEVDSLEEELREAEVDLDVLKEYSGRYAEYVERKGDLNESVQSREKAKEECDALKKRRYDEFMAGFNQISSTLKEMYHMITMGGNAELELVDSLDPFSEGILFSVMPPRKSWKNISNLSGGEKTLSSLALVFALHSYKPTPLYVMDEIDAALDFRNVSIVANYIKGRTKNAQFVVISLRNNMFELAEKLVGIYKVNNMTRSVTINNRDMVHNVPPRAIEARPTVPANHRETLKETNGKV